MGLPRISTPDSPVSPRCRVTLDSLKLWMFGWNGHDGCDAVAECRTRNAGCKAGLLRQT